MYMQTSDFIGFGSLSMRVYVVIISYLHIIITRLIMHTLHIR